MSVGYIFTLSRRILRAWQARSGDTSRAGAMYSIFSISFLFLWGSRCSRYFLGILGVLGNLCAITNLGTLDILGILGGGLTLQSV